MLLFLLLPAHLDGQQNRVRNRYQKGGLLEYANYRNRQWIQEKKRADALAKQLGFPVEYVEPNGRVVILQRLGPNNKPVYYATDNISAADVISADQLWTGDGGDPFLTGQGVVINVWDGGAILSSHQEFQSGSGPRIEMVNKELTVSNHSTHIAGTMAATGVLPEARGMAGNANIYGWDFSNDFAEMAVAAADGMVLSNHSYGSLTGWYHNTTYDTWYWYGDPGISEKEDYEFGYYNQVSAELDFIAWSAPQYLIVKSAGNDRGTAPESQPVTHMVWDNNWVSSSVVRDPDGGTEGYDCLTPMSVAKNILTVGAVDDLGSMTTFSAFGPTDDGRIKPDLVANGTTIYSSIGTSSTDYGTYNGTSMAAASVTGSLALLCQLQEMLQPGVKLNSATLKGLLIHTASETGTDPGPDYRYGWGLVDMKAAADLMEKNADNGGLNIREGTLREGEVLHIPVKSISSSPWLKVTVCWTDPAGNPSAPSLNSRDKKLVNDLNLLVEHGTTSQQYLPWTLDAENPGSPAVTGVNQVDNVEQVFIPNPGSDDYIIKLSHSGTLSGGAQQFSLVISGISAPQDVPPPDNLRFSAYETSVILKWDAPGEAQPQSYMVYRDGNLIAETKDLSIQDLNLVTDRDYNYYVKARYERDGKLVESLSSNSVTATPRLIRPLPFTVDFEEEPEEIIIKNNPDGWQWGDSESLNDYYLNFSSNETRFIGTSSYSAGETAHVMDIAATVPLRLADYSNVKLSFDYFLLTGIYDAIDELHVVYKLPEEGDWREWQNLPVAKIWKSITLDLPEGAYRNGTQIGFCYDDFYQWGMGAALDNISVTGPPVLGSDLAITSMTKPVSSCTLSEAEDVTVTITHQGGFPVLPGDVIPIQMKVSDGTNITDQAIMTNALAPGESLSHTMSAGIDMTEIGTYLFEFTIAYENDNNILNNSLKATVETGGIPEPVILNEDLSFCTDDETVPIQVSPEGGTLTGPGVTGLLFNPLVAGAGTHTLTYSYTDAGGCEGKTSVLVEVTPLPEPAILNEDLSFCIDSDPVPIQVSPEGGTLSGPGVTGLLFYPSVAGAGIHTLIYSYTDAGGCEGTTSMQVEVTSQVLPVILVPDLSFCLDAGPVPIQVSPEGGILSGPGVTGLLFYPSVAGAGTHTLTYTYSNPEGCGGTATAQLEVTPLPEPVILNSDLSFCVDGAAVQINATPQGGTLSGPGVTGMYFYPSAAGVGTHTLTYSYTDPEGCEGTVPAKVDVTPLPAPAILNSDLTFREDDPAVLVEVYPEGGELSGPGITGFAFDPSAAGVGQHTITYIFSDPEGCTGQTRQVFTVTGVLEPAILNTDLTFCINDPPEMITVTPPGGTLDGPGISGIYFDPSLAGTGSHEITYTCPDGTACTGPVSVVVNVIPLPATAILNKDLVFCENDQGVLILTSPTGGILSGPGCIGNYFYPRIAGPGLHTITYSFTDGEGCIGSCSKVVLVSSLPKPAFLEQREVYCENEPVVEIGVEPEGGILDGPGVSSYNFVPANAGPGLHTLTYTYADNYGCFQTIEKLFLVKTAPVADLGPDLEITLNDTIVLKSTANAASFQWFDGSEEDHVTIIAEELGTGTFDIWVNVMSTDSCTDSDSIQVTIDLANVISKKEQNGDFNLYPNPVEDGFYLKMAGNEKAEQISIYSQTGQVHMNNIPSTYPYFDVSNLLPGSYILKVQTELRVVVTQFIKY